MGRVLSALIAVALLILLHACMGEVSANKEMAGILAEIAKRNMRSSNPFCADAKITFFDSLRKGTSNKTDIAGAEFMMGTSYLESGKELMAVTLFEKMINEIPDGHMARVVVMKQLAMANLRIGERSNCVINHSGESCIFPIAGKGVHVDKTGSERAIELYKRILQMNKEDLESRWLLNIAYMTIGGYPTNVPAEYLIKGLDADSATGIKPFKDVAIGIGLNTDNLAGGSIIDDFNNDGSLDLITSSWSLKQGMHYCRNNANGTFTDVSDSSGLSELTGGLNIIQTDYNNDGLKDIFVLRGAWMRMFGRQPNSLLKNNGDGTFTDVTRQCGLLSFHPTQTATWADFNNDGWLDVFIGNETTPEEIHASELFMNNGNGTFTEMAQAAGCDVTAFVKGVTSGDYDNDGLTDIFVSTLNGRKVLLKNISAGGKTQFRDVTQEAGLSYNKTRTFPTWFWDYDNDGWLDIFVAGYEFDRALSGYVAAEALGMPVENSGKQILFRNKHDGTFEDVSVQVGLTRLAFAMGSNFGDIDNDGFLDIYLGTGNPEYQSLVPNKMFKNIGGSKFVDVTTSARVGNLQKGHAVSFADLDNDGDQDIYIEMGGAYDGDAYQNSLYVNPGQTDFNWIDVTLEGTKTNRLAIGAKIKVTFVENGVTRSVYRDVNSGGSFGSNPLMQHIGIGSAVKAESVEIKWPRTGTTQSFKNIAARERITIKEGANTFAKVKTPAKVDFTVHKGGIIGCGPQK